MRLDCRMDGLAGSSGAVCSGLVRAAARRSSPHGPVTVQLKDLAFADKSRLCSSEWKELDAESKEPCVPCRCRHAPLGWAYAMSRSPGLLAVTLIACPFSAPAEA